jgi:hypothetical protein
MTKQLVFAAPLVLVETSLTDRASQSSSSFDSPIAYSGNPAVALRPQLEMR